MSWLRVDDGFADHPKLLALSPLERWTWIEVLCYCARYRTGGHVPAAIAAAVPRATPRFLRRVIELGLLDEYDDGGREVHDWKDYNGPLEASEKAKKRYRMRRAGIAESIVREVAPYSSDDLDFEGVSAPGQGLPEFGDILGDVAGDISPDISPDIRFTRAVSPTPTPKSVTTGQAVVEGSAWPGSLRHAGRVIWDSMSSDERAACVAAHKNSTGARWVRGSHGVGVVLDPLGTDRVDRGEAPPDYDGRVSPEEFIAAWAERRARGVTK